MADKKKRKDKEPLDPQTIEILNLKIAGTSNKEIASMLKIHEGTVSRKLNEAYGVIQNLETYAKESKQLPATKAGVSNPPAIPEDNPLALLQDFSQIAQVGTASGVMLGSSIHSLEQAFTDEKMTYEESAELAAKGAVALAINALAAFKTYQKLKKSSKPELREIKNVTPHEGEENGS